MTINFDTASCSCLRAMLDDKSVNLSKEKVVTRILQMNPGTVFHGMSSTEFKPYVLEATNDLARQLDSYKKLSADEKVSVEQKFKKRCIGCLISLLPEVISRQAQLLEAA